MNNLDRQYIDLLNDIRLTGVSKGDRTGTGTTSVFGRTIRHNMSEGFPLLTTKKMAIKAMATELKWFLKGGTNITYLVQNGCNIWVGDCYKRYLTEQIKPTIGDYENYIDCYCGHTDTCDCGPMTEREFIEKIKKGGEFADKWGQLGKVYGAQWRNWDGQMDQIKDLLDVLKNNPDSRRMMVTAWNPTDVPNVVLPPCHYGFQCWTRELTYKERYRIWFNNNYETGMEYDLEEVPDFDHPYYRPTATRELSLSWNQRSVDTPLGLPFNIASYGLLLELLCKEVNMKPGELIGFLGDTHIYNNQMDGVIEQINRKGHNLPTIQIKSVDILNGEFDYEIYDYEHDGIIKFPLSN